MPGSLFRRLAGGAVALLALGVLAACDTPTSGATNGPGAEAMQLLEPPAMRWGERKNGDAWRRELLAALDSHGLQLASVVPGDIGTYCPGYAEAEPRQRKAFWAGFVSALAKHESTWNPAARGGGGKWLGLMQIAPSTWRGYGCEGEIFDGGDNLSCAVRIMNKQVGRDGLVAGGGNRGVGRDWGPMRSAAKRADIASWTSRQSYCQG